MARRDYKPGPGWTYVGSSVWDHASGMRLHMLGMLRMPLGELVSANIWPESRGVWLATRLVGGSRKRGLMLWALWVLKNGGALMGEQA